MDKPMRIVVVHPDEALPEIRQIDGTLKSMQEVVGGYIESVLLLPGTHGRHPLILVCNEDGRLISLPYNRRVCDHDIYGSFFFCSSENDDFVGLSEADAYLIVNGIDWTKEITI